VFHGTLTAETTRTRSGGGTSCILVHCFERVSMWSDRDSDDPSLSMDGLDVGEGGERITYSLNRQYYSPQGGGGRTMFAN